jgi:hypothetical protein
MLFDKRPLGVVSQVEFDHLCIIREATARTKLCRLEMIHGSTLSKCCQYGL